MAVLDSLTIRIVTNAQQAARDIQRIAPSMERVRDVAQRTNEPIANIGSSLTAIGEGGVAAKAGASMQLVAGVLSLIGATGVAPKASRSLRDVATSITMVGAAGGSQKVSGSLGSLFSWLVRIGSFAIPGGAAIKVLAGGAGLLFGLAKTRQALRAVSQSVAATVEEYDRLGKTADKLGILPDQLVALRFAAEDAAGVTAGQLDTAVQRLVRRTAEAARGTGEAVKAYRDLRLDARELAALRPEQVILRIADAMQGVADQNERVRIAFKLFDTEGVALVNLLNQGPAGIQRLFSDAQASGLIPNPADIAAAQAYAASLQRANAAWRGVGNTLNAIGLPFRKFFQDGRAGLGRLAQGAVDLVRRLGNVGTAAIKNNPITAIKESLSGGVGSLIDNFLLGGPRATFAGGLPPQRIADFAQQGAVASSRTLTARSGLDAETQVAARRNLRPDNDSLGTLVEIARDQLEAIRDGNRGNRRPPVFTLAGT